MLKVKLTIQDIPPEPKPVKLTLEDRDGRVSIRATNGNTSALIITFYKDGNFYRHRNIGHFGFDVDDNGRIQPTSFDSN